MKPESDYWVITKVVATDRVSVADIGEPFGVVGRTVYCKRKVEFVPLVDLEHYHPGAQSSQSPPEPPETPSDEPIATGATGSGPEPAEAFWDAQDVGEAPAPDEGISENHRIDALLEQLEQAAEAGLEAEWESFVHSLPVLALVREVLGLRAELAAAAVHQGKAKLT